MTPQNLMEFIDAAHLSTYVRHPLKSRGGVFLVGPPESFKTSILDRALKPYHEALVLSDINTQQLGKLKEDITRGRYTTIAFREFSKLFERDPRTARNTVGHLRAFTDEGFTRNNFQDPRMQATTAYCVVMGAMTESFYSQHFTEWVNDGFARRFLWVVFDVKNINKAVNAILDHKLVQMDGIPRRYPGEGEIPFDLDSSEKRYILGLLREQRGQTTPTLLLSKMYCVLVWKHKSKKMVKKILDDVAPAMSINGATLVL